MSEEILINVTPVETRVAVVENLSRLGAIRISMVRLATVFICLIRLDQSSNVGIRLLS